MNVVSIWCFHISGVENRLFASSFRTTRRVFLTWWIRKRRFRDVPLRPSPYNWAWIAGVVLTSPLLLYDRRHIFIQDSLMSHPPSRVRWPSYWRGWDTVSLVSALVARDRVMDGWSYRPLVAAYIAPTPATTTCWAVTALIREEFYITIQTRPGHDQIELANLFISKSVRGVGLMRATRCDIENMDADICFNNFNNN